MGTKSEKVPKENIRVSSEDFWWRAEAAAGSSTGTNGQEVIRMFQRKFFQASTKKVGRTGDHLRRTIDVTG